MLATAPTWIVACADKVTIAGAGAGAPSADVVNVTASVAPGLTVESRRSSNGRLAKEPIVLLASKRTATMFGPSRVKVFAAKSLKVAS